MEQVNTNFNNIPYSSKNIPIPSRREYKMMLIDAINRIYHNVAWKAWHFLNPNQDPERVRKETYGFPTTKNAPNMDSIAPELKEFTLRDRSWYKTLSGMVCGG